LESCDETDLIAAVGTCDALLVRSQCRVTRRVLDAAPRLRVIGRAGVGLENIDVAAAEERGVAVLHTPEAATDAVADLTLALMLALVRRLSCYDHQVRQGIFHEARTAALREMADLTVGIIGFGRIGQAVGRRCHYGFGMPVLYNDIASIRPPGFPAQAVAKQDLYRQSDIVSLHVPLTEATRGLIDREALAQFKTDAILINTARGAVVDSTALAAALRDGRLAGAGLDVFDPEPLPLHHPLLSAPNTLFTPHIGARTDHGLRRMSEIIDAVITFLQRG
jgi:D-3-phosphoglycerate dehydrogenase